MTAAPLTPTVTKAAAYQALVGDLVLCDATFASFVVTLPAQSQAGDQVAVKLVTTASSHTVTVLNGPVTASTLKIAAEEKVYQSDGAGTWTVIAGDLSLTQLDSRYAGSGLELLKAANLSDVASASSSRTNLGLGTAATVSATAGGDLSGTLPTPTVVKVNGTSLAGLATGLLKNTTGTGVPSIAAGSDVPNIAESQVTGLVSDLAGKAAVLAATGTATLSSGTVAVADVLITAISRIRVYVQTPGGTVGAPFVSAITASTGFTITSTSVVDTSVVRYEVVSY